MAMSDTAATLLERFNRSWKGIDRVYHEIARRSGLSDCAFWILYALRDAGTDMPQNELSQVWLYSRQTVSSTLRQLEERGLINVQPGCADRRHRPIRGTAQRRDGGHMSPRPRTGSGRRPAGGGRTGYHGRHGHTRHFK